MPIATELTNPLACEIVERMVNEAAKLLRGASTVLVEDTATEITHA